MKEEKNISYDKSTSLGLLWSLLPKNLKRFTITVFIVLIISTFFVIYFAADGYEELVSILKQASVKPN